MFTISDFLEFLHFDDSISIYIVNDLDGAFTCGNIVDKYYCEASSDKAYFDIFDIYGVDRKLEGYKFLIMCEEPVIFIKLCDVSSDFDVEKMSFVVKIDEKAFISHVHDEGTCDVKFEPYI